MPLKDCWARVIASSALDASPQFSPGADRSDPVQVTKGDLYPSFGHWSPEGPSIVFNDSRTGEMDLAAEKADRTWTVAKAAPMGFHPVYSADGQ